MRKNKKLIEQAVYSLLLEYPESSFLSIQYAYSLEEAMYQAKEEYCELQKKILGNSFRETYAPKLSLFASKSLDGLVNDSEMRDKMFEHYNKMQKAKKVIKKDDIKKRIKSDKVGLKNNNDLMKEIIEKKDLELLKKNIKVLSDSETLYIKSKIK